MCGIICIICSNTEKTSEKTQEDPNDILQFFKDYINNRGPNWFDWQIYSSATCTFLFAASVLWLQGNQMTKQPLEDGGYMLIYNGDIFRGLPSKSDSECDSEILFTLMRNSNSLISLFSQLQGPYAFVFYDKTKDKLHFGRDKYGRRSLLIGKCKNDVTDTIILSSVAKRSSEYDFIELPSIGIFCYDFKSSELLITPWMYCNSIFDEKLMELKNFLNKDIHIENHEFDKSSLVNSLQFTEPKMERLYFYRVIKSIAVENVFDKLLSIPEWLNRVLTLEKLLESAVEKRIMTQPKFCKECIFGQKTCSHSLTGVLFSGGIDCAVLALLADRFTDKNRPIDLINVAFDKSNDYQTPDRITGLQTLKELQGLSPKREWHFIEVNVSQEELNKERNDCIADLIYPLNTILDDSLGCALWFASRGKGETSDSPCRILVVGMGADELFGGYTRHRAAFKKEGWLGLHTVLIEDWQNLPYRNLARDDRVVSNHGRQLRTPYLDENVIEFVRSLNSWEKTYPSDELPQGIGEKILLRTLAYYLGLKNASTFKKRALQFGSRIANKKENAHEISPRLAFKKVPQ